MVEKVSEIKANLEAHLITEHSGAVSKNLITFDPDRIHHIGRQGLATHQFSMDKFSSDQDFDHYDLVCLSHLRWDFVYQRPQHLLGRAAGHGRIFFVEEPIMGEGPLRLDVSAREEGVTVVVPHIPHWMANDADLIDCQNLMIDELLRENGISKFVLWYYTPMALKFSRHLQPLAVVYDCMDELSAFKDAPGELKLLESELFHRADLVFTGGQSLYEAKCKQHESVYAFPSAIDATHFMRARVVATTPDDQKAIPEPRIGFFGVIDERFDIDLLASAADLAPELQFVVIGPVVKIDEDDLPKRSNIHYLGPKSYKELPEYLAGWKVAILPFARNESTRFISPTKTPEYLAAGCPVVSTSIRDVVRPYGQKGLVHIADTPELFVTAIKTVIAADNPARLMVVDAFLKEMSWDLTWSQMKSLIDEAVAKRLDSYEQVEPKSERLRAIASAAH